MADENRVSVELVCTPKGLELFDQAGKKVGEFSNATGKASGVLAEALKGVREGFDKELEAALKAAQGHKGVESSFSSLGAKIIEFNQLLEVGQKVLGGLKTAFDGVFAGIERGGMFDDLSKRIGVSVETLSSFELAAKTSGVSLESFGTGVQMLSRNMASAAGGSKEAQEAFAALGVSVTDANGNLRSSQDVLLEISDAFSNANDGAAKTALAMDLLGRSGAQLIPFLNEGADGLRKWQQLSSDLGLNMTTELAASMDAIGDSVEIFGAAITGVQNQLAIGLAPALSEISAELVTFVSQVGIGDGTIRSFGESLGTGLKSAFDSLRDSVRGAAELFTTLDFDDALEVMQGRLGVALESAFETAIWAAARASKNVFLAAVDYVFGSVDITSVVKTKNAELMREVLASAEQELNTLGLKTPEQRAQASQFDANVRQTLADIDALKGRLGELAGQQLVADAAAAKHSAGLVDQRVAANLAALGIGEAGDSWRFYEQAGVSATKRDLAVPVKNTGEAAKKAADEIGKLRDRFEEQIRTQTEAVEKMEGQNEALQQIIDGNLSAADAQTLLNDATGEAAAVAALAADATAEEAAALGNLAIRAAEAAQKNRELQATRGAQAQTQNLQQEAAILQQVIAGTKSQIEAEHELAVLRERSKGVTLEQAEAFVTAQENVEQLRDRITEMDEDVIHLGDVFKDSFEQAFDAVISGTRDMGDVLEGIGIGIGKRFFSAMLESKLRDFDPTVKANFLDLGEFGKSVFGGLFSGGGGSSGGGSGGGALSLLGGNGGGLSLATVLGVVGPGIGAGGAYGTYGTLAGIGTKLLFEGAGHALISNLGQDALALLGGETFAGTVGDWAGNSGWFSTIGGGTTWGGSLFGGGSVAGSFGGGAIGAAAGSVISAGLGLGASFAGQATADAFGIRPLQGTEGQIHMAIGNAVAQIIGNYFGGPLGGFVLQYLNEILQPLLFGALGIAQPPTKGTMQRRMGESYLDSIPVFAQLQEQYGDVTRKFYRTEDAPWLADSRAALGEDAMRDISGFAGIFAQLMGGDVDGGGRVAGMVEEWTNILTDFFGRMDQEGEETGLAIRQHLAQAFRELGVDAGDAMEIINDLGANLLFAGGAQNVDYFGEQVSNVTNLGEAVRGTAAIFESELPPGIHIAALALESMSRDGEKAFKDLDTEGRETLVNLAEDAENFDAILAHLFEQGFTIDTEEFEQRLEAITQSATFLGENLGAIFNFDSAAAGVEAIFQQLKGQIFTAFQGASMEQLFGSTNIAAAFEPVYAALARIDEFDLTTATGAQDFMAILTPALAEGKANLQDYLPVLQVMIDNWKEIQKIIDEAMKPDVFEQAALVAEEAFNGIGGALSTAIDAGLAVLEDGGTWDQAVSVFSGTFGAGVEATFKSAIFNAIVQSAVIEPLVASFQPAFQYVVAAGLIHGFDDPRVQEAFNALMRDATSRAEELGVVIFKAKVDSEGITSDIERAFNDAADITLDWASDFKSQVSGALDSAFDVLRNGGTRDEAIAAWSEALNSGTYNSVLDAIARALIDAALLEPFIAKHAPAMQYITAAAIAHGWDDPRVQDAMQKQFGPGSAFQNELRNIGPFAIDMYATIVLPDGTRVGQGDDIPPGLDLDGSQSGTGGRRSPAGRTFPGRTFPGAATGGSFPIGQTLIVGENGPELLMSGPDGIEIVPLSEAQASALLDPASPQGRTFPGRTFPTNPPTGGGRDNGNPIGLNPNNRRRQFPNPTSRPKVPPPPAGRPGVSGLSAVDVEIDLNLDDAIETFLRGGSLTDFREALEEGSKAAVIDGLVKGMLESGPIKKAIDDFNAQMSDAVEKAMRDGVIDAQEQADLDALGVKLSGSIETAAKTMQPVVETVGKALGIGMEQAAEEAAGSVSASLDGAIRTFLSGGSVEDMEDAVNQAIYDATTSGIIEALLTTGPLAGVIDKFGSKVGKAISDALEDGEIDAKEGRRIRRIARKYGAEISDAISVLGPVLGPMFTQWAEDFGIDLRNEVSTVEGVLGPALRNAILNGDSIDTLKQNIKQALYESVVDGMVDAFIDSAVVQGLLAGPMAIISGVFQDIADGQIDIAEANNIIITQFGVINGLLDDPTFLAALQTFTNGIANLRSTLGLTIDATENIAQGFADVADAAQNACAGECEWERKLVESEEKNATLDEFGRQGYETTETYSPVPKGPSAEAEIDINDTLGGDPNGRYGWLGSDADWRRHNRWLRRQARNDGKPGYYGTMPRPPGSTTDDGLLLGPPGNPPDDGRDFVGPNAATNGPMLVQDEGVAALRAEVASLRDAILSMPPPTVTLDGREISKNSRKHQRRESRGGPSTQWGVR